jgi:hypothetical protein
LLRNCSTAKSLRVTRAQLDRRNSLRRAQYRKNPKPFVDSAVKWKRNHPDKFLEYQRSWQKKNRKRINVQRRARYQANAQKFRARSLAWSKAHAEQVAETKRKCYYANLDRELAAARARYRAKKARLR